MTLSAAAGPVSQMRDILTRGLRQGFADYCGVTVAGARWPWSIPDLPCLLVYQSDPFIDPDDVGGTACTEAARFDLVLITGEAGRDQMHELQEHWANFIVHPWAMSDLRQDDLFPSVATPLLESVGAPRVTDMFGHLWVASISTVRADLHIEPKKGAT